MFRTDRKMAVLPAKGAANPAAAKLIIPGAFMGTGPEDHEKTRATTKTALAARRLRRSPCRAVARPSCRPICIKNWLLAKPRADSMANSVAATPILRLGREPWTSPCSSQVSLLLCARPEAAPPPGSLQQEGRGQGERCHSPEYQNHAAVWFPFGLPLRDKI